jgi:hypothetical protein
LALVKIRQPDGSRLKYVEAFRDPARLVCYPGPDAIRPGRPLVVVEGEFDALCLGEALGDLSVVVTLGSASGRPEPAILAWMLPASRIYIATDADPAGDKAASGWPARTRRVRPPEPFKDWTEAKAGGMDLARWWHDILADRSGQAPSKADASAHEVTDVAGPLTEPSDPWPCDPALLPPPAFGDWPPRAPELSTWPISWRERWGRRANELEEAGERWRYAERIAFIQILAERLIRTPPGPERLG